jgi:lactate permease
MPSILGVAGTQFKWTILYNPGLFPILFVVLLVMAVNKDRRVFQTAGASGRQVLQAAIAIAVSFSIVQIMIFSNEQPEGIPGMLNVIATAAAACLGKAYILAAPFIGVLGTFFSGSCTVSNILFGSIQFDSACRAGLPPDLITALQNIGGGIGSMIRISGVVATTATVNAVGKEGKILCLNCIPAAVMVLLALLAAFICM